MRKKVAVDVVVACQHCWRIGKGPKVMVGRGERGTKDETKRVI
jgi:hypothetical protein